MKKLFGLMLMATMLLSASAVFADHAPPNQTAESISYQIENPGNFANIEAIQFDAVTVDNVTCIETVCPMYSPAQTPIAVLSGQGFWRNTNDGPYKPGTNTN